MSTNKPVKKSIDGMSNVTLRHKQSLFLCTFVKMILENGELVRKLQNILEKY